MRKPTERDVVTKVFWRLLPFSTLLFVIAAIDQTNVGFAAGVFFIGYALFEIPSNLILERTSARF